MRYPYSGTTRNQEGATVFEATVSVFLTGTSTPASIYTASSGGTAVNSVTSSSTDGTFLFYVDSTDYVGIPLLDLTVSKTVSATASYNSVTVAKVQPNIGFVLDIHTLTANYAPTIYECAHLVFILDPGADDRNVNPVVGAGKNYAVTVVNSGSSKDIVFDSAGIATTVATGAKTSFYYTGSAWV
jgi:hypothetical protein